MNAPSDTVRRSVMDQRREAVEVQEKLAEELRQFSESCHGAAEVILDARTAVTDKRVRKILTETARKLLNESQSAADAADSHMERAKVLRWHASEAFSHSKVGPEASKKAIQVVVPTDGSE